MNTDSSYSWRRLGSAMLIGILTNASVWTSVSLMPSLEFEFGLSRTAASYPYMAIMLGFLLGGPTLGRWSDVYGITRVLQAACIFSSASYVIGGLTADFRVFVLSQFCVGLGTAAGVAPLTADISHWFRRRRGLAITLVSSSSYLAGILWTTTIGNMLEFATWRTIHIFIGCVLLAVLPLSLLLRRRVPAEILDEADAAARRNVADAGIAPRTIQWLLAIAGVSCCIAMAMPQIHIVALCMDLGFSIRQGNELISVMLVGAIASRLLCGAIIDRVGAVKVLLAGSLIQMLSLVLFIPSNGLPSLYVVSLVFGIAQGGILPSYPLIVREYAPARHAGAVIGFVSTSTQLGMAIGGWWSGWFYDQTGSYSAAFVNSIFWNAINITLVGLLLFRTVLQPARPEQQTTSWK